MRRLPYQPRHQWSENLVNCPPEQTLKGQDLTDPPERMMKERKGQISASIVPEGSCAGTRGHPRLQNFIFFFSSKLREIVKDREAWHAAVLGVTKSQT